MDRYHIDTHTLCEGVEDLQTTVVFSAFAKIVIHKVRPVPGHPLAPGDDVTHSEPMRKKRLASMTCFHDYQHRKSSEVFSYFHFIV